MPTKYLSRKFLLTVTLTATGCVGWFFDKDIVGFAAFSGAIIGAYGYFDNSDPHKHDS